MKRPLWAVLTGLNSDFRIENAVEKVERLRKSEISAFETIIRQNKLKIAILYWLLSTFLLLMYWTQS